MDIERLMPKSGRPRDVQRQRGPARYGTAPRLPPGPDPGRAPRAGSPGGLLLFDSGQYPLCERHTPTAQIFNFHTPSRALFVRPEGKCVLFDQPGWGGAVAALGTVAEVRDLPTAAYFYAGPRVAELSRTGSPMRSPGCSPPPRGNSGDSASIASSPRWWRRSRAGGDARLCPGADGACTRHQVGGRDLVHPGLDRDRRGRDRPHAPATRAWNDRRNELFAILHHTNIAMGGEQVVGYRLLASGRAHQSPGARNAPTR